MAVFFLNLIVNLCAFGIGLFFTWFFSQSRKDVH